MNRVSQAADIGRPAVSDLERRMSRRPQSSVATWVTHLKARTDETFIRSHSPSDACHQFDSSYRPDVRDTRVGTGSTDRHAPRFGDRLHRRDALPGVTVTARSESLQGTRTAVTDMNGIYEILGLPNGKHVVRFTLDGFADAGSGDYGPAGQCPGVPRLAGPSRLSPRV